MALIIPKSKPTNLSDRPLFFLAGPVRGAGNWQEKAYWLLMEKTQGEAVVVTPVRYATDSTASILKERLLPEVLDAFPFQTAWERYYLQLAGDPLLHPRGCILFWLCCEDKDNPHPGPEPYSMDTRGELGEWRGRRMFRPDLRFVIGGEEGYHGLRAVKRNFNLALNTDFPVHNSLEETVAAAVDQAQA